MSLKPHKVSPLLKWTFTVSACTAANRFVEDFAEAQPPAEAYTTGVLFGLAVAMVAYCIGRYWSCR